jgi:hypothetical protein
VSRTAPPSGAPPPETAALPSGEEVRLGPLAGEVARRYFEEFPDDLERYGSAALDWCIHDSRYILAWAIGDLGGHSMLARQADWLASVLGARDFPLDRLARNLELASAVLGERLPDERETIDAMFAAAAASVRAAAA